MTQSQFDQIYTLLSTFANDVGIKFAQINERFDKIEGRLDKIELRLDKIEGRLDSIESVQAEHTKKFQEIFIKLEALDARIAKLEQHTSGLEDDVKYLYKMINDFKKDYSKGKLTDKELNDRLEEVEAMAKLLAMRVGL